HRTEGRFQSAGGSQVASSTARATAMRTVKATLVALMLGLAFAVQAAVTQLAVAQIAVPQLSGRVVDRTATLGSDEMASLERTLKEFEARKGSQIAVL